MTVDRAIEVAQTEDEDELWRMLLRLHEENGIFAVNEAKVRDFIQTATRQDGGIIALIRGKDSIEASIGLIIQQFWYTDDWSMVEFWMFVTPEHRKSTHAVRLLNYAKRAAEQLGVPVFLGIMSLKPVEAKERLYQRKFSRIGGLFMHHAPEVPHGLSSA